MNFYSETIIYSNFLIDSINLSSIYFGGSARYFNNNDYTNYRAFFLYFEDTCISATGLSGPTTINSDSAVYSW